MRLFVAIQFSPAVQEALLQAQSALQANGTGRFTPQENFHLTLAFLGQTETSDAAIAALEKISLPPFPITVAGVGNFGDLIWAGVQPSPALAALQQQVQQALQMQGFPLEARTFMPHLTLCRRYLAGCKNALAATEAALNPISCLVERISLMESQPSEGRMIYREIFSRELG